MSRVYLIFHNRLFADAVRAVLAPHADIELVEAAASSDRLASDLAALAPDVILLEETQDNQALHDVRSILVSPTSCRLIMLPSDADGMHVWSQTWRQTVQPEDLVEAIVSAGVDKS